MLLLVDHNCMWADKDKLWAVWCCNLDVPRARVCVCVVYLHSKSYIQHSTPNAVSDTPYHMHTVCVLFIALCDVICCGDCTLRVAAPSLFKEEHGLGAPEYGCRKRICRSKMKEITRNEIELLNEKHHSYHSLSNFKTVMKSATFWWFEYVAREHSEGCN